MQTYIYYGQYTGFSWLSRAIQVFTWSKRSHTAAFYPPDSDGNFSLVIEAWRKGVTVNHWTKNHKPGTVIDVYKVQCSELQQKNFYVSIKALEGARYDFLGIAGFLFRRKWEKEKRWFCSEAVFSRAFNAGIVLLSRVPAHKVSPAMMDLPTQAILCRRLKIPGRQG